MQQLCIDDAFEFNRLMRQALCQHRWLEVPMIDWERDENYGSQYFCMKCGLEKPN